MAGKGGYQAPSKPAMSSGPGAMSQRTDGGPASKQAARYMAGGDYGDGTDMMNIQQSAPMAATPSVKGMSPSQIVNVPQQQPQVTPMFADSQLPDQPVTQGVAAGAGAGPEALNLQAPVAGQYQDARSMINAYAASPMASPALTWLAQRINGAY